MVEYGNAVITTATGEIDEQTMARVMENFEKSKALAPDYDVEPEIRVSPGLASLAVSDRRLVPGRARGIRHPRGRQVKRIVVISDMQIPYHSERNIQTLCRFIKDYKPDEIASVGDEVDFPQISRWNKGMVGEYKGSLQRHVDAGRRVLGDIRKAAGDVPFHVMRSNHMDRPLNYINKYAPGLLGLDALLVENLLDFENLGITYHKQPWRIAPDWLLMHGDEGGMSQIAGQTARKLADKTGMSVVCGHTHRQGLIPVSKGVGGRQLGLTYGFEVGNLMNLKQASYLGGGIGNWQQGFGTLNVEGRNVTPVPVPIHPDGSFTVDGHMWGPQ